MGYALDGLQDPDTFYDNYDPTNQYNFKSIMKDKNTLFSEIKRNWKDEYGLMDGLRGMDQPYKILGIFQRFWELLLFLIIGGTTVPLVFVNAVVESDATIFIVILM